MNPPTVTSVTAPKNFRKIDSVTALQEGIDGLSLAMFEALRGLRDAVAAESGNLSSQEDSGENLPTNTVDDAPLVEQFVNGVMEKSRIIDQLLAPPSGDTCNMVLPGIRNRTRMQQLAYIQEMLQANQAMIVELKEMQEQAVEQQMKCRHFINTNTESILNLVQEEEDGP